MSYQEPEINTGALKPGSSRELRSFKLNLGDNIYRILPPFGTNHNGVPFAEHYLHWFTDPTGKQRPLACSKKTERFCPVCEEASNVYKEYERILGDFKSPDGKVNFKGMPDEINKKQKSVKEIFDKLRAQRGYYYNAMDQSGTVGVLRLPKTAADELGDRILEAIQTMGFNPLSLKNGTLFNIKQVAKDGPKSKMNVEYKVEFVRESENTADGVIQRIKKSSLPESVILNFEKLAYDVHTLYPTRTSAELKRVMLGDKMVWADIDAAKKARQQAAAAGDNDDDAPEVEAVAPTMTAPVVVPTSVAEVSVSVPATVVPASVTVQTGDDDIAELRKNLGLPPA